MMPGKFSIYVGIGKNNGKWFFVEYANQADKKIFFTEYANQSDVLIYFVKYSNHL